MNKFSQFTNCGNMKSVWRANHCVCSRKKKHKVRQKSTKEKKKKKKNWKSPMKEAAGQKQWQKQR